MSAQDRQTAMDLASAVVRREYVLVGLVQGVGMRPFVARLARGLGLAGLCRNSPSSVVVEVEGPPSAVEEFAARLVSQAPPLAVVDSVRERPIPPTGRPGFTIAASGGTTGGRTLVAPDTAPCVDCLRELADPSDRRFRHPFITCTNCGPRFTITLDLPYDRPATTMAGFPLCPACAREYADPADRRYHAQPIACHDCGPTLTLRSADGTAVARETEDVLARARAALAGGAILAVKGLGGYHLACDAANPDTVGLLRRRKHRPDQPFAVMPADLATAGRIAVLAESSTRLLLSPARPIVLVPRSPAAGRWVCDDVAPRVDDLGVLLPYTPVHLLLMGDPPTGGSRVPRVLVMTSGNRSGEPLCVADEDALHRLQGIADLWLTHDRPIALACEDSVVALDAEHRPVPVRRSRGYAPIPVRLAHAEAGPHPVVLAAGADLKNTFTIVRDGMAFVSAHVGDLGSLESRTGYHRAVDQAERFHRATPALVVADRHPGYLSRAWAAARSEALGVPLLEVQHHHAHLAALAAEHGRLDIPLVGLVFDGTGYGCDATIWGGELLRLGPGGQRCERLGHLGTLPLPGGDAGVRNPVRMAAAALAAAGLPLDGTPVAEALTPGARRLLGSLPAGRGTWVPTSSVGRLFDVVSSLLGVCHRVSYEAQAAIELEAVAARWARTVAPEGPVDLRDLGSDLGTRRLTPLGMPVARGRDGPAVLDPLPLLADLTAAVRGGVDRGDLAWHFHAALADGAAELAAGAVAGTGEDTVGLTGGVFQNRLLSALTVLALARRGLRALTHRLVPPNDGGISLGQAAVGVASARAAHSGDDHLPDGGVGPVESADTRRGRHQ
ncbi:MAG TPA: carbamoyltransferase HypF [Candidatus Lustribacter sp.]|nr:carbamoyltransferase HypF [Candidatus Lustribacter sp.]